MGKNIFGFEAMYMDYVEKAQNRRIVLFGVNDITASIIRDYFVYGEVEFICDNNKQKHGKSLLGIPICSPDRMMDNPDAYVVLIMARSDIQVMEISSQLKEMGVKSVFHYSVMNLSNSRIGRYDDDFKPKFHELNTYQIVNENMDKIQKVRNMLSDDKSLFVYDEMVRRLKYNIRDYTDICDDVHEHYFTDGVFEYGDDEVLVDGGSYDGMDTIRFAEILGSKFKKAYCFEPDRANFSKAYGELSRYFKQTAEASDSGNIYENDKFKLFRYCMHNRSGSIGFSEHGLVSSKIKEDSGQKTPVTSIDDAIGESERVTLIKMDLEGAEIPALEGGRKIIQRHKPKLALSIYHEIEDLWEIPLLVKEMVPEYRLFVRHHTTCLWDKVLYATL